MTRSKKLLVPFDRLKPEWNPNEFLVPWTHEGKLCFRGLKNGRYYELGRIVYIGEEITENDLFAKLVDSGSVIANVDETLAMLRSYIICLQSLKIGNVACIRSAGEVHRRDVVLELVANTPSAMNG